MQRTFAIAVAALSLLAFSASAASTGPYKLDAKGKCHDAKGGYAKQSLCAAPVAAAPAKRCKDPKTHRYAKCTAPGAVPA